ncbi:MAG: Fic family protein [Promicromonosporaceae bacterium]|nr:Fic family protein [Promicromonosporaceae bacterium]
MDLNIFVNDAPGQLVDISGSEPLLGHWQHKAFLPDPLPQAMPPLSPSTFLAVANARAALAALDSTGRQLPNPTLLRMPTLRREAQSTSALEGTYAPLPQVFTADENDPANQDMVEILNYVHMANAGYAHLAGEWPISVAYLCELQGLLMAGTPKEPGSGRLRDGQVVIGRRPEAPVGALPVEAARFVPPPPGPVLEHGVGDLVTWLRTDHTPQIDPVISAAMAHYQFETLHPFHDGNGRLGRFLIVAHLQQAGVLTEPTLTVSPWFEARREQYYNCLLGVSTRGDWDTYVKFFADGIRQAAEGTRSEMVALSAVQAELKDRLRASSLRADSAHLLVDLAVANPTFTVRKIESELGVSYARANKLAGQLVDLGILDAVDPGAYKRRFYAPEVLKVLVRTQV